MSIHSTYKPTYALGADGKGYWWGPPPRATGGGPFTPVPFTGEIPIRAIGIHDDGACGVEAATGGVYCWSGFLWDGPTRIGAVAVP